MSNALVGEPDGAAALVERQQPADPSGLSRSGLLEWRDDAAVQVHTPE
jgi:hypothetical protein